MSFSGLKSQTIRAWDLCDRSMEDLCYSFEQTITDTLTKKVALALDLQNDKVNHFVLAGGVAANKVLREKLGNLLKKSAIDLIVPDPKWCTDNAAMIAAAAMYQYKHLKRSPQYKDKCFIKSSWSIEE